MRIFVFEYVTGGGLQGAAIPASLVREGDLMLHALVSDLSALRRGGVSHHPRCPSAPDPPGRGLPSGAQRGGVPPGLGRGPGRCGCRLAHRPGASGCPGGDQRCGPRRRAACSNSAPAAVRTAASKLQTVRLLESWGVPVVPTFGVADALPADPGPWVLKPDDGVGCLGIRLCRDRDALCRHWGQLADGPTFVAQPFVQGTAASLSLLVQGRGGGPAQRQSPTHRGDGRRAGAAGLRGQRSGGGRCPLPPTRRRCSGGAPGALGLCRGGPDRHRGRPAGAGGQPAPDDLLCGAARIPGDQPGWSGARSAVRRPSPRQGGVGGPAVDVCLEYAGVA